LGNFRWRASGGAHYLPKKALKPRHRYFPVLFAREELERGKGDQFSVSANAPAADKPTDRLLLALSRTPSLPIELSITLKRCMRRAF
jgi:hypothetical protein